MTHLRTPDAAPLFDRLQGQLGFVPNWGRVFGLAPDVYTAWEALVRAVKAGLDERRYELVTLAAARAMRSACCTRAHAAVLRDRFYDEQALRAIVTDPASAGLDPADVAAMELAERMAIDPHAVTPADIDRLRGCGLSESDIFFVVLAVSARRFFAGTLEALGVAPEAAYDCLAWTLVP